MPPDLAPAEWLRPWKLVSLALGAAERKKLQLQ
jgi:hypothetical protein